MWHRFDVWDDWARLTRFLRSTQIAHNGEVEFWENCLGRKKENAFVFLQDGGSQYKTSVKRHIAAINDEHIFSSMALAHSYSLVEKLGREALATLSKKFPETEIQNIPGLDRSKSLNDAIELFPNGTAIEVWGKEMLEKYNRNWDDVLGGRAGLVEVSVYRNAAVHGFKKVNQKTINRLLGVGATPPWNVGDPFIIDFSKVHLFRQRLQSFMRTISGAVAMRVQGRL